MSERQMTPREIAGNLIYSVFRAQDDRRFGQLQDKIETLILEERAAIKALAEALRTFLGDVGQLQRMSGGNAPYIDLMPIRAALAAHDEANKP